MTEIGEPDPVEPEIEIVPLTLPVPGVPDDAPVELPALDPVELPA